VTQAIASGTAVYRFFDAESQLLYVGITSSPRARFFQHRNSAAWWGEADHERTTIQWYGSRIEAVSVEAAAIRDEKPRFNISGTRSCAGRDLLGLSEDAQEKLRAAIEAAREAHELREAAWEAVRAARVPGVSDERLCEATGFSRATLNRRFGPRKRVPGDPGE